MSDTMIRFDDFEFQGRVHGIECTDDGVFLIRFPDGSIYAEGDEPAAEVFAWLRRPVWTFCDLLSMSHERCPSLDAAVAVAKRHVGPDHTETLSQDHIHYEATSGAEAVVWLRPTTEVEYLFPG